MIIIMIEFIVNILKDIKENWKNINPAEIVLVDILAAIGFLAAIE